jgi:hypothetical protein
MNLELPVVFFYVLAGAALVTWLCALQYLLATMRKRRATLDQERELLGATPPDSLLTGTAEVAGQPAELAVKAASVLAKQGLNLLGPVKITEQTDTSVGFEGLNSPAHGVKLFDHAELRFSPAAPGRTRIDWALQIPPRSWLLVMAWVFIGLGLLAMVTAFSLIQLFVVNDLDPALRWQAVQMVQCIHFIWPPFLFVAIYRRQRTHLQTMLDAMVNNLPYYDG